MSNLLPTFWVTLRVILIVTSGPQPLHGICPQLRTGGKRPTFAHAEYSQLRITSLYATTSFQSRDQLSLITPV